MYKRQDAIWSRLASASPCNRPGTRVGRWVTFLRALGTRDWPATADGASDLLATEGSALAGAPLETLLIADLTARLVTHDKEGFIRTRRDYLWPAVQEKRVADLLLMNLVLSQALVLGWRDPLASERAAQ